MTRQSLNKSSLHWETRQLKAYQRFLPSLDLKRKQLLAERGKARLVLRQSQVSLTELHRTIASQVPMLADHEVGLDDLVTIVDSELGEENLLGTRLPLLRRVRLAHRHYAFLSRPHWVDRVQALLAEALELQLLIQVHQERLRRLDKAVQKITQRVNLFDKVLIPRSQDRIRRIGIYLSDAERAAVVRAKIAKSRRLAHD